MFITQTPRESNDNELDSSQKSSVLNIFGQGDCDFQSPCLSMVKGAEPIYEDISDDDFQCDKLSQGSHVEWVC